MIPDNAIVYKCPHCGEKKELMSLLSGNTFDARYWSDYKTEYPELPEVSLIQKCPKCGKYYLISRMEAVFGDDYSEELGELSYEETLEAVKILLQEELTPQEEASILLYFIHAFNDKYNRDEIVSVPIEEDKLFKKYIHQILQITDCWKETDELILKAELLRESGLFNEALAVIESILFQNDQEKQLASRIKVECAKSNRRVFELSNMENVFIENDYLNQDDTDLNLDNDNTYPF